MTEPNQPIDPTPTPASQDEANKKRRRRWLFVVAALPLLAFAGFAATRAAAGPWGHHHCGSHDPTPEEARGHVDRWMEHVLDHIDATDEQRAEISLIVDDALPQMLAFRREGRELKQQGRELVMAEPIDRAGLERVRTQGIELANRATARGLEVFISISEVLTPEQRAELADHWRRGPFHR